MFRWNAVADKTLYDMTVKMYRDPFVAKETVKSYFKNLELDHYAYKYFDSELLMYRILDTNFEQYIEERGNIDRLSDIQIPLQENVGGSIL
jgi:hypothetical protein